jgi:hypothetical protein
VIALLWRLASVMFCSVCVPLWFAAGQLDQLHEWKNPYSPDTYEGGVVPAEYDDPTPDALEEAQEQQQTADFWRHVDLDWVI